MTSTPHPTGYRTESDTTMGHIVAYGRNRSESMAALRYELEQRMAGVSYTVTENGARYFFCLCGGGDAAVVVAIGSTQLATAVGPVSASKSGLMVGGTCLHLSPVETQSVLRWLQEVAK